ncbi:dihydrofolate reductase [Azospirillum cavernae]|uniref:Dihydrofolate reductase n=1 Tax=Azospirillum cavernae TaxID=2320860 RepID=A0A418VWG2_9PROT|nr:dihydrofolate reductase [Azospirillum cavernae]RJF81483.1 dihydrofolate reductase [Azospirillum cavernae]
MRITLVVAAAANGVIGKDGGLPWDLPSDLKRFKELTLGKPILMGRKTWNSLPRRPLPGRDNLVVSRTQPTGPRDGAHWFRDYTGALDWARKTSAAELCVIGGAALFADIMPLATRIHLTRIDHTIDGDTILPPLGDDWVERWSSPPQEENGLRFQYVDCERVTSGLGEG